MLRIPQLKSRLSLNFALLALMVAACTSSPDQRSFIPEEGSLLADITFSYPKSWKWEELAVSNYRTLEGIRAISPYSENKNPSTTSVSSVFVIVTNRSLDETTLLMNREIKELLLVTEESTDAHIVEDQIFEIDGHYTQKITRWSLTSEMDKPMIEEFIYILDEDRYYSIHIAIPEEEQDGQFHNEFKAMIESIKILP